MVFALEINVCCPSQCSCEHLLRSVVFGVYECGEIVRTRRGANRGAKDFPLHGSGITDRTCAGIQCEKMFSFS